MNKPLPKIETMQHYSESEGRITIEFQKDARKLPELTIFTDNYPRVHVFGKDITVLHHLLSRCVQVMEQLEADNE